MTGACGGAVEVIARIETPLVIEKRLSHLNEKGLPTQALPLPESRVRRAKRAGSSVRKPPIQLNLLLPDTSARASLGPGAGMGWKKDV